MIELMYKWDGYCFNLYKLEEGEEKFIGEFSDREDLLIFIEQHYAMAKLIVLEGGEE